MIQEKKVRFTYEVHSHEVDFTSKMNIISVGNVFMSMVGFAAEYAGFGLDVIHKHGLAWVILRMHMEVSRYPKTFEKIQVETWVENSSKFVSQRNCVFKDESGTEIVKITSLWSVINFETRHAENLEEVLAEFHYQDWVLPESIKIPCPEKIGMLQNAEQVGLHTVAYSDIDSNMHANSMRYFSWVLDTVSMDVFRNYNVKTFEINYIKECRFGEQVSILCNKQAENIYVYEQRNSEGVILNRCRLTFE